MATGPSRGELAWLKGGAASLWLTTALGVLHPHYRAVGHEWLSRLGLPDWLMWLTCAGELALGVIILVLPPRWWLMAAQVGAVAIFTVILAALEPMLLVHPFGVLSKNYPFLALVVATWLLGREGFSARALWTLRGGMALVWITEGIFPKILFPQPLELAVVEGSGLVPMSASLFLMLLGVAQAVSGVLALVLEGAPLRVLLAAQVAALVVLPALVSWQDPLLWFHPFGPLTKNLPVIAGTVAVFRRCR
ncbi:MAG: hypothetical protein IT380_01495 [Myxococcales bacterium]|nr:hypothetical protein [Myxococcales bacterium]